MLHPLLAFSKAIWLSMPLSIAVLYFVIADKFIVDLPNNTLFSPFVFISDSKAVNFSPL